MELLQRIKIRRKYLAVFSVLFVLVVPLASISYTTQKLEEWTEVVYESPAGGEILQIGEWVFGSFTGHTPSRDVTLTIRCEGEILEGGGNLENKTMNFHKREMLLSELLELNATELEDEFGRSYGSSYGATSSFSFGGGGPIYDGNYIWILRFISVGGLEQHRDAQDRRERVRLVASLPAESSRGRRGTAHRIWAHRCAL